jgi:hypothetical protein
MFQYFNQLTSSSKVAPASNNFLGVLAFSDTKTGSTSSTDFDLAGSSYTASGNTILKINNDGVVEWSKSLPNVTYYSISLGNDGYIYACGTETSLTYTRSFFVKYSNSGTLIFQNAYYRYSATGNLNRFYSIDADASGNVYVLAYTLVSSTVVYYVLKFNSSGVIQWQKSIDSTQFSQSDRQSLNYLRVDTSNNIHLLMSKQNATTTRNCQVITKLDTDGNVTWSRFFGQVQTTQTGGANLSTGCVQFDQSGNVFIAGVFSTTRPGDPAYTPNQVFILTKYNSSGVLQWYRQIAYANIGTGSQALDCFNITFDTSSNIYVSVQGFNSNAENVGYVYKFDSAGSHSNGIRIDVNNSPYDDYVRFINHNADNTLTFIGSSVDDTGIGFTTSLHEDIVYHRVPIGFTKTGTYNLNSGSITYATFTSYLIGKTWGSDTNTPTLTDVTWTSASTSLSETTRPLLSAFVDI